MEFNINLKDSDLEALIHNQLSKSVAEVVDQKLKEIVEDVLSKKIERGIESGINVHAQREIAEAVKSKFQEVYGSDWYGRSNMKKHFDEIALNWIKESTR